MGLFDLFNKPQAPNTQTEATPDCAWCLEEQGTLESTVTEGHSHGICQDHSNQMRYQYHERKYNRVPSYTSRYRDGQQAYWEEEE